MFYGLTNRSKERWIFQPMNELSQKYVSVLNKICNLNSTPIILSHRPKWRSKTLNIFNIQYTCSAPNKIIIYFAN